MGALGAVLLYIIVLTFSDTDAAANRWRILGIALGAGAFEVVLSHLLPGLLWTLLLLIVEVALIALALVKWCGTPRSQALKVTGIFTGVRVGIGIVLAILWPRA
jgi:hypothetical protein